MKRFIYIKKFSVGDKISENNKLFLLEISNIQEISYDNEGQNMFRLETKSDIYSVQFFTRMKVLIETIEELEIYLNG